MSTDVGKIKDIDARIIFRSIKFTGDQSTHDRVNFWLVSFTSKLRFIKSLRGLKVGQIFRMLEDTNRISEVYRGNELFRLGYKEEFLKLVAENFIKDERILYYLGSSKEEGGFLGLAVVPTNLFYSNISKPYSKVKKYIQAKILLSQKSDQIQKEITDHLMDILKKELGQERWEKILEMSAGSRLLRSGTTKSWPIVGNSIYTAYTILLPIYPARAHMHPGAKRSGERAKYPKALLKELVQLFQERFPEDFKDLTEKDVVRCIQYRRVDAHPEKTLQ
jgi:hypothetical protein